MCEKQKWRIRLMLWVGLLVGGIVGMSACAGDPPSALGILCNSDQTEEKGGCWGKNVVCDRGYCRQESKECPTTCKANDNCRAAMNCGAKTICEDGKCVEPTATCPSSCEKDADCEIAACGANEACINGKCEEPSCPATCEKKEDCEVDDCGNKTDCHAKDKICIVPAGGVCKNGSCKTSADCVGCRDNKTACEPNTGRCIIQRTCAGGLGPKCVGDLICQQICKEGTATCQAGRCVSSGPVCKATDCQSDNDCVGCPNNESKCAANVCVDPNAGGHGYNCSTSPVCDTNNGWECGSKGPTNGVCTKPCTSDNDCTHSGTATYKCLGPNNDQSCHITCTGTCPEGLTCCPAPQGKPHRLCSTTCP